MYMYILQPFLDSYSCKPYDDTLKYSFANFLLIFSFISFFDLHTHIYTHNNSVYLTISIYIIYHDCLKYQRIQITSCIWLNKYLVSFFL
eukprot:UN03628